MDICKYLNNIRKQVFGLSLSFDSNILVSYSKDDQIISWDVSSCQQLRVFKIEGDLIQCSRIMIGFDDSDDEVEKNVNFLNQQPQLKSFVENHNIFTMSPSIYIIE